MNIQGPDKLVPPVVEELLHLVGLEATLLLVTAFPGEDVDVGMDLDGNDMQQIQALLGKERASKIQQHFEGTRLSIPRLTNIETRAKHIRIVFDVKQGLKAKDVGRIYNLTERQVRSILCRYSAHRIETPKEAASA